MVTRSVTFCANEHYHVYNRGNSRQTIYRSPGDYHRFIKLLYIANTTTSVNIRDILKNHDDVFDYKINDPLVTIQAFCLMPNHYHLLITPLTDEGLSKFMMKLGTGYSMYFNTKYERTGSLFEGRYKAKLVNTDNYLKYLFSYIHINPIRDRVGTNSTNISEALYKEACGYPYSSLPLYINPSSPRAVLGLRKVVDTKLLGDYLPDRPSLKQELMEWITYNPDPALGLP